jgi:SAM-dependent methyltransferase
MYFICGMNSPKSELVLMPDVIGEAIWRHQFKNTPTLIALSIDGLQEEPMRSAYFFRTESEMNEAERQELSLCTGRVLDVGAGAGCHALVLQEKGLEVIAVEQSVKACEVLADRGVLGVLNSDILQVKEGNYDTVLLLMNGFGIGRNEQGVVALLKHVKSLLAPGGKIIGDSTDIRYFREEREAFDLSETPPYEVMFEVQAHGLSEHFSWIYPDEFLLEALAEEAGLKFKVLMYADEFHFLCEMYV